MPYSLTDPTMPRMAGGMDKPSDLAVTSLTEKSKVSFDRKLPGLGDF